MRLLRRLLAPVLGLPILVAASVAAPAVLLSADQADRPQLPIVVNTWAVESSFSDATAAAWAALQAGGSAVDAVEQGCSRCESLQCDRTVGYGGSPDEAGETSLDALVMDGSSMRAGAVSNLRRVRHATRAARLVMEHTSHTMLAGEEAASFAVEMGLEAGASLATKESREVWHHWVEGLCQPNFRRRVAPDPTQSCGPYTPLPANATGASGSSIRSSSSGSGGSSSSSKGANSNSSVESSPALEGRAGGEGPCSSSSKSSSGGTEPQQGEQQQQQLWPSVHAHDTIAMVVVAADGSVAAGSSSNGAIHKVPGRVGDASVPGGGAYADSEVGGCGATGDGDVHLSWLPCYQAVESMRRGLSPTQAAEDAVRRIARRVPGYVGAVVAVDKQGRHGAAAHGWSFVYSVASQSSGGRVEMVAVAPLRLAAD